MHLTVDVTARVVFAQLMRRGITFAAVVFLAVMPLPASAGVVGPCSFDAGSATATVVPQAGSALLSVESGDQIWVDGQPCETADTSNTDTIVVTAALADGIEIDLGGGPFAPGLTDEGDATSEIEFQIDGGPAFLTITGSNVADHLTAGTRTPTLAWAGEIATFNLNAAGIDADADVLLLHDSLFSASVALGGGRDAMFAGTPGTDQDTAFLGTLLVEGGAGADTIQPGFGDGGYWGDAPTSVLDPRRDTLTIAWVAAECQAIVENFPLGETYLDCTDSDATFDTSYFEKIVGHDGPDYVFGAGWREVIRVRGGDDAVAPGLGSGLIEGGQGWDYLIVGETDPVRVDLTARRILGEGPKDFAGVEGVFSVDEGKDVFTGEPSGVIDIVGGGDGRNVVDLRTATRGFTVYTVDATLFGPFGPGLWVHAADVLGTPFDDRMTGEPGAYLDGHDVFRGLGGDDHLNGGEGPDTLLGGTGDDVIAGGVGLDTCSGGHGFDVVSSCEL